MDIVSNFPVRRLLVASLATALLFGTAHAQSVSRPISGSAMPSPASRAGLVGAYRLAWLDEPAPDGRIRHLTDIKGSLVYTPEGQISVQVMYPQGAASESAYAQGGYEGSFGTYTVDAAKRTVIHHLDGANVRGLVGKSLPRRFQFVNGILVVRSTRPDEHWAVGWRRIK